MTQPSVSVIVPVYNVEAYLRECMDSILAQTLKEIEVICINDGSPDNSLAILQEYAAKDARVKVIDKKNEGVGKARNDGIAAATGEYIAFMDSDDYYPNASALEHMYQAAKEHGVKICGGQRLELTGKVVKAGVNQLQDWTFETVGHMTYAEHQYDYGYWQYIYERAMLVEHNVVFPPYARFQDPPFFVRAMITAGEFYAIDEPTYCYRVLPTSTKYTAPKTLDMMQGLCDNLNMSKEHGLAKLHYVTAHRLDEEASFMVLQNMYTPDGETLLAALLETAARIDGDWLRENGFAWDEAFVPQAVLQMREAARQYEALRETAFRKIVSWLPRKLFR